MFPGDALPRAGRDSCDGRPPRVHASAKSWSPHPGSALRGCRALGSTRPASGLCPCAPFGPATAGCHLPAPSESSMVHSFHQCIRIFDLRPNLRERSVKQQNSVCVVRFKRGFLPFLGRFTLTRPCLFSCIHILTSMKTLRVVPFTVVTNRHESENIDSRNQ